jgi:hypothetical protein
MTPVFFNDPAVSIELAFPLQFTAKVVAQAFKVCANLFMA